MNYYERHIGDFIRDTVGLSMIEDGAYNRLLDQAYQTERPIPKDMVYRLARATTPVERKAVDYVLATFFELTDDGYRQKRVEVEIARYQDKQRKAKASADARWSGKGRNANADANASKPHDASDMRTHSEGNAHQTPDTRHQSKAFTENDDGVDPPLPSSSSQPENLQTRSLAMVILLRDRGVRIVPGAEHARQWALRGVTDAQLLTAAELCEQQRAAKGDPNPVNSGYVNAVLDSTIAKAAGTVLDPKRLAEIADEVTWGTE